MRVRIHFTQILNVHSNKWHLLLGNNKHNAPKLQQPMPVKHDKSCMDLARKYDSLIYLQKHTVTNTVVQYKEMLWRTSKHNGVQPSLYWGHREVR